MNDRLVMAALETLGTHEKDRDGLVSRWIRKWVGAWAPATTAWCGVWLAEVVSLCGGSVPDREARALAWTGWGRCVAPTEARAGDVIVFEVRPRRYHVALVLRVCAGECVWVIGGNQGDMVSVRAYPWAQVCSVRRSAVS